MSVRHLIALAVAALVALPVAAGAQSLTEMEITRVDGPDATTGDVVITVKAPAELAGEDIPADAFQVTEDAVPLGVDVERLPSDELQVVLVVDTSGSMEGAAIEAARSAARTFLTGLPSATRIGIIGFGDAPIVLAPLGSSRTEADAALDGLVADGSTTLFDAILVAAAEFGAEPDARRAVVVLSDGADTSSAASLEDVRERLATLEVSLDAIALSEATNDTTVLAGLTDAADTGRVVPVERPEDLAAVYDALATALVNQYELTVRPRGVGPTELGVVLEHRGVVGRGSTRIDVPDLPPVTVNEGSTPTGIAAPELTVPARDAPPSGRIVDGRAVYVGAAAFFVAFAVAAYSMLSAAPTESARLTRPQGRDLRRRLGHATGVATALADQLLGDSERTNQLADRLERAGWRMRPGEFLAGALTTGLVTMLLTATFAGFTVGAVVGVLAVGGWYLHLNRSVARRQAAFVDQQAQLLQLLAGGLRVGRSLPQALESVARELPAPSAPELRRVVTEVRLGRDLHEALGAMADRLESDDFRWVVQAIGIHRDVGGDLAEVLDNVRRTVNERERLRSMVGSLSAEGRMTAWLLMAMPPLLATYLHLASPGYLDPLVEHPIGMVLLLLAVVLTGVGLLWIRRLIRFSY
ncbi:MAG: type II secretion system F family protein [Actinomycetota bacterium]